MARAVSASPGFTASSSTTPHRLRGRDTSQLLNKRYHCEPGTAKTAVDLTKSLTAVWRRAFHEALRGMRKVALRLGEIPTNKVNWRLRSEALKDLLNRRRDWTATTDDDFVLDLRQKGVDMRLGLDIAAVVFKRQVNQIVLVSGDADFVPAAKLARREGIDFVLDPMWATIRPQLFEHIDGLRSVCPKPA